MASAFHRKLNYG